MYRIVTIATRGLLRRSAGPEALMKGPISLISLAYGGLALASFAAGPILRPGPE